MTTETAKMFVGSLVQRIGLGFHPETPLSDYIDVETGRPTFGDVEATDLQTQLDAAIQVLGEDVYDVAIEATADVRRAIGLPQSN